MDTFSEHEKEILRSCLLLESFSDESFNTFLNLAHRVVFDTDAVLLKEGDQSDDFFIILSGTVGLYKDNPNNSTHQLIRHLNSGQTIGEMRVIQNRKCSLTVIATEPTTVLRLSISALQAEENHRCYESMLQAISIILNDRLCNNNLSILGEINEKRRKHKQLLLSLFGLVVLILFLCEVGLALYYSLNADDFCNQINHYPAQSPTIR